MSNNQLTLITVLGVSTVFVLGVIAWSFLARARTSMAKRLEKSIGLAIPDELRTVIGQAATRRSRISLTGLILGVWAALPLVWSLSGDESTGMFPNSLMVIGTMFVGTAIGAAIGSLTRQTHLDEDAIRYARPEAVTLDDYVAPFERRGAWIVVGLATVVYGTSIAVRALGIAPIPLLPPATFGGVLVVLALASLLFFEIMGRRIVGRAQPTGSESELVWGDAMRSANVRGLLTAPVALGVYGVVTCSVDLAFGLHNVVNIVVALVITNVMAWLAVTALIIIAIYSFVSRPQRHFLTRLWPQYVDVGAPPATPPHNETVDSSS